MRTYGALWLLAGGALALAGCGGSGRTVGPTGDPTGLGSGLDGPAIVVGGFQFLSTSARLTHPYFGAQSSTPQRSFRGYGPLAGETMTQAYASGGTLAGIGCLQVTTERPGSSQRRRDVAWLAQDTQGNIHVLQREVLNDGSGGSNPKVLLGVAAGAPAAFLLPRTGALVTGLVWYERVAGGTKQLRNKVLSTSATSRGKSLLLRVQTVRDANGDGRFATSFAGPDERTDAYWEGSSAGLYVLVVGSGPAAGFVRQAGAVTQVNLQGSQFSPRQVTVPAGSVVKWTNKESLPHTITVDATNPVGGGPNSDAQFPSGFGLNQSYNWTVPNAPSGTTFYYHCRFHGAAGNGNALGTGMSGSVTVQ